MQAQMKNFLEAIKIPSDSFLLYKDLEITNLTYNKNISCMIINIKTEDILNVPLFRKLLDYMEKDEYQWKIYFDVINPINELAINTYFYDFIFHYFQDSDVFDGLKRIRLSILNDEIIIPVSEMQKEIISEHLNELKEFFFQAGIKMGIHFNILKDEEEVLLEEIIYDSKPLIEEKIEMIHKYHQFQQKREKNEYTEVAISQLRDDDQAVTIKGTIFDVKVNTLKSGKTIYEFYVTDYTDSIIVKTFESKKMTKEKLDTIKKDAIIAFKGNVQYDDFARSTIFNMTSFKIIKDTKEPPRQDNSEEKRVELHLHTHMSTMDATNDITAYLERAIYWGHNALAITDHGGVQAFPDAQNYLKDKKVLEKLKGKKFKVIYGTEAYLIKDRFSPVYNEYSLDLTTADYVILDLETTGLSSRYDEIIEFGAVKISSGVIVDSFESFINPKRKISQTTINLTGITDHDVVNAPTFEQIYRSIRNFIGDSVIVAHNALFDYGFLNEKIKRMNEKPLPNAVIDTLDLAKIIYPTLKRFNLGALCRFLGIDYLDDEAHRASYDATILADCFLSMLVKLEEQFKVHNLKELAKLEADNNYEKQRPVHATILAKNDVGLKNLFKIVSIANTEYIATDTPFLPRGILSANREGLLIGSACFNGEIFDIAQTKSEDELLEAIKFYDYIELQPLGNYQWLVDTKKIESMEVIKKLVLNIYHSARKLNKLVVATGDVHYLDKENKIFRDIYIATKAKGAKMHPLYDRNGLVKNNPDQHFKNTEEMLEEFAFLGKEEAYEIVVTNTNKIAFMIDFIYPIKDDLFTPKIEGAEDALIKITYENAEKTYGNPLPDIVKKRLDKEFDSIIKHGFGVIYYLAYKLVNKSVNDGYLVGSRGSVGSSFVATMAGITEVNPLKPHYLCTNCCHSDFEVDKETLSGYDLPYIPCPKCGQLMKGEGQDIPFETFLGIQGDKVPDIDLNFSGAYQARAHEYTKELLGPDNVFRAGTISTVAEKTARGYVKNYYEELGLNPRQAEINRIAKGCEGVKKTTGQHPGGIIVIPKYMDVYDITPIAYPADEVSATWRTSHFDFHAIHDEVLKLDILGHVDPTALRMLHDITDIDPKTIPMNDEKVLALFDSPAIMGISREQAMNNTGTAGIPEFGTNFVKKLLEEAKPRSFSDLVQISGLSHGTDVWANNAQELIRKKICNLNNVIGCRDDIMSYLQKIGLEDTDAFFIMESVRKGKGLTDEMKLKMRENKVPEWYIDSCLKIKYMFPKAHAVAYVVMALRVAWYKVYRPLHYYATFFSTRCTAFEIETLIEGKNQIRSRLNSINNMIKTNDEELTNKDSDLRDTFDVALEMCERGFSFGKIDLEKSLASEFVVDEENSQIIPPFTTIDGLGESVAQSIIKARNEGKFLSKEDFTKRTSINNASLKVLEKMGLFKDVSDENQLQFIF